MVHTAVNRSAAGDAPAFRDNFLEAYRMMQVARLLDDKFASLYRAGKIHGGVFLGRGQEALSVSVGKSLRKGDVYAPLIRDAAGRLAFGESIMDAVRTYMGSAVGPMAGRDGNVHRGRPRDGYLPMISHLGAMVSVVNGVLMAHRFKGTKGTVGAACIGEGGTSTGSWHEAMNQAAVEKLPLVMVVANNHYAYSTPSNLQFACATLADKAVGYGIEAREVDGTDLAECLNVVGDAVARARDGAGPQLVVARLLRLCGHGEHDDASYVDSALKQSPVGRDCLTVAEGSIREREWASAKELAAWRQEALSQIEEAVAVVQREPAPDPYKEKWSALASAHLVETHDQQPAVGRTDRVLAGSNQ